MGSGTSKGKHSTTHVHVENFNTRSTLTPRQKTTSLERRDTARPDIVAGRRSSNSTPRDNNFETLKTKSSFMRSFKHSNFSDSPRMRSNEIKGPPQQPPAEVITELLFGEVPIHIVLEGEDQPLGVVKILSLDLTMAHLRALIRHAKLARLSYNFTFVNINNQNENKVTIKRFLDDIYSKNLDPYYAKVSFFCYNYYKTPNRPAHAIIVRNGDEETKRCMDLHKAARNGDIVAVKRILLNPLHTRCDSWGRNAIHEAAQRGHHEVVGLLMGLRYKRKNQKPSARAQGATLRQSQGHLTPGGLSSSGSNGSDSEALDSDSEIEEEEVIFDETKPDWRGQNPLHLAAEKGQTEVVELLIRTSTNVPVLLNAVDTNGRTPLHVALYWNRLDIARMLASHPDIDISIKDNFNNTCEALLKQKKIPIVALPRQELT